jgi:WS/DGAT/MGAT family acyltransferase
MRELSGLDAALLAAESWRTPLHMAAVTVFDPASVEGGYSIARVKERLDAHLHRLPSLRWRLVEPPLGLGPAYWIEDPEFDLEYHVRRVGVPAPGGRHELGEIAAEIQRRRLDRRRPLWEWWVVEGLAGGLAAHVWKIHQACLDANSGAALQEVMFDTAPDAKPLAPPPGYSWRPEPVPSELELLVRSIPWVATTPLRIARGVGLLVSSVGRVVREDFLEGLSARPPRTSFNAAVSQHRNFAFSSVSLDEVKRVKNAFGTKLNDVVLALCAGALRRYLHARGELPAAPLIASVPVSVRGAAGSGGHGSEIAGLTAELATDEADPVERLRRIQRSTQASDAMPEALGAKTIMALAETPAPMLLSLGLRYYARTELVERHRPLFNVIIAGAPGPRQPLYAAGAEIKAFYPMGMCFDGAGLFIGLMSYRDQIDFGLLACRELVRDPWYIADAINKSLEELVRAAPRASP